MFITFIASLAFKNICLVWILKYSMAWFPSNPSCLYLFYIGRSSNPEVFLEDVILKICSRPTREHPCQSFILIKLQGNVFDITLRHGCSPVNLLHIFRTAFTKNTSGWLLQCWVCKYGGWCQTESPSKMCELNLNLVWTWIFDSSTWLKMTMDKNINLFTCFRSNLSLKKQFLAMSA